MLLKDQQRNGCTVQVKQVLEDNFPEGLLSDKKELLRPDAGLAVDGLGSPVLQSDSGKEPMAVHRFKLCEAPESVKVIVKSPHEQSSSLSAGP